jgi:hypothetical protein
MQVDSTGSGWGRPEPTRPHNHALPTYTISSAPGDRVDTAATIPDALAALAYQLAEQLPHGPVAWTITDPTGIEHGGTNALNGRLDLLTDAIDGLLDALYTQLHRSADGGPHASRQ